MMKKMLAAVGIVASGVLVAPVAMADTGTVAQGQSIDVYPTGTTGIPSGAATCEVLQSTVKLGTSTNVHGVYECRAATATTPAAIGVATCHPNGLIKARSFTCTSSTATDGSTVWSPTGCTGAGSISAEGSSAFMALSLGGAVSAAPMGAACSASALATDLATKIDNEL